MNLPVTVDILGWLGALILIAAYVVISYGKASGRSRVYQALNVAGSALLVVNTAWHRAWPSSAVNILWAAIGIGALICATTLPAEGGGSPTQVHDTCGQKTDVTITDLAGVHRLAKKPAFPQMVSGNGPTRRMRPRRARRY